MKPGRRKGSLLFLKRMIDVVGSALALVLFAPVLLVDRGGHQSFIAGPGAVPAAAGWAVRQVLYVSQIPVDVCEQRFAGSPEVCDRADYAGRGEEAGPKQSHDGIYKIKNDRRITRVGRFLRRTSLDELPQLVNVLKGEMSLVGPRPAIPYELAAYQAWHRRRVLQAKPGITGLWQVAGRSRVRFDEMVRMDLRYATSWTPWLDIKILLLTPLAVLRGTGAY